MTWVVALLMVGQAAGVGTKGDDTPPRAWTFEDDSVALRTRFRWRGREGVHYNVHLRSYGAEKPWDQRIHLLRFGTWAPFLRQYRAAYGARAREISQPAALHD